MVSLSAYLKYKTKGDELVGLKIKPSNVIKRETYDSIKQVVEKGIDVDILNGKVLSKEEKPDRDGYLTAGKHRSHHLIGYFIFGERMIGKQINHVDGNKSNNKPTNLELTTPSENVRHAFKTGLKKAAQGEDNKSSKLTEKDVYEIRSLYKDGKTLAEIGKQYGIAFQSVSRIVNRQRWGHLPELEEDKTIKTFQEYQEKTRRTANSELDKFDSVSNYSLGLISECAEITDELKKVLFHEHEVDLDKISKEMGDTMWYFFRLADELGINMQDVATQNISKLAKRYPEGFSVEASINRVDTKEAN